MRNNMIMFNADKLPPTLYRMYNVLKDGNAHTDKEMKDCVNDELSSKGTLSVWIFKLKEKLEESGLSILVRSKGTTKRITTYRLVTFITGNDE